MTARPVLAMHLLTERRRAELAEAAAVICGDAAAAAEARAAALALDGRIRELADAELLERTATPTRWPTEARYVPDPGGPMGRVEPITGGEG